MTASIVVLASENDHISWSTTYAGGKIPVSTPQASKLSLGCTLFSCCLSLMQVYAQRLLQLSDRVCVSGGRLPQDARPPMPGAGASTGPATR